MNTNQIYELVRIVSFIIEIYLVMDLYDTFHKLKKPFQKSYRSYVFFAIAVIALIVLELPKNDILFYCGGLVVFWKIYAILYEWDFRSGIRDWGLAVVMIYGAEITFWILSHIDFRFPFSWTTAGNQLRISGIIGVRLISFVFLLMVKQLLKRSERKVENKLYASFIILSVASLLIMMCVPYIRPSQGVSEKMDIVIAVLYIIIVVGDILLLYFLELYGQMRDKQMQKEVQLAKYKEKQWHYSEIDKINKQHSVYLHNMNLYLKQIATYAKNSENEEILKTIRDLNVEFLEEEQKVICQNMLLNSILLDFRERAREQYVHTDIFVEAGFKIEFMNGIDITAVFGNLLENALEAASQCEEGKIDVKLFMQNDGAFSVIRVENNYSGELQTQEDELVTTKKDKTRHGIGVKNVKHIVEKYDGMFSNEYENQIYKTLIAIPCKN